MAVSLKEHVLELRQLALSNGDAFAAGQRHAPLDINQTKLNLDNLAKTLQDLGNSLITPSGKGLLEAAKQSTRTGFAAVLQSCGDTLKNLELFMDQHRVIKKHRTLGGFAIEQSWSESVLNSYQSIAWIPRSKGLNALKHVLQSHADSVGYLHEALQSKSVYNLNAIVEAMTAHAKTTEQETDEMYAKMEDIRHLIQISTIATTPNDSKSAVNWTASRNSFSHNHLRQSLGPSADPILDQYDSRLAEYVASVEDRAVRARSPKVPVFTPLGDGKTGTTADWQRIRNSNRNSQETFTSQVGSGHVFPDSDVNSIGWPNSAASRDSFLSLQASSNTRRATPLLQTPELWESMDQSATTSPFVFPLPALNPIRTFDSISTTSRSEQVTDPTTQSTVTKPHRGSTTTHQKALFEKEASRNSAILCDLQGLVVEYSHRINEDNPTDVEMVEATTKCRIVVVRKRVHDSDTKAVRIVTSIWTFSEDNSVRMELRMDDSQMYIPYSSYFSPAKISVTVPCELRFHDIPYGAKPASIVKTSWINYTLETTQAAASFQNELMGRTLLATFRTESTMRIHEGLSRSFQYAEQMCALENLRIWEDNDTGAIIALIHFSASFRIGYLAFYLNSSVDPIRVKDDGAREIKIKGLRVPLARGDRAIRKDSVVLERSKSSGKGKSRDEIWKKMEREKVISGARIEFASDWEKMEFLAMIKELQKELIELPDLLGVN